MEPKSLADLVHKFSIDPGISPNRKSMTKTSCSYAARSLGFESTAQVSIHNILRASKSLRTYLGTIDLSPNSRRNYDSFFNRFIKWCQEKDYLPKEIGNELLPEWLDVTFPLRDVRSGRKGWRDALRKLAYWATSFGLSPDDLTPEHLRDYITYLAQESSVKDWRQIFHRAEREWQHQFKQGTLPSLEWPRLPTSVKEKYALMLKGWPEEMQIQYKAYRDWCLVDFSVDRPRQYKQRPVSADQNLSNMERIVGFAYRIKGVAKNDLTMDLFFDKEIIPAYFQWLVENRLGRKITVTLGRIAAQLLGMARGYFQRLDAVEWLLLLKIQVSDAPVRDKKLLIVAMEELNRVADGILEKRLSELKNAKNGGRTASEKRQAILVRSELVYRLFISRPLRQKNVREIHLDRNLIRDNGNNYRLKYDGSEMKNGIAFELPFPKDLTELLETYLEQYRPILCNGHQNEYLFPNPNGGHICDRTVQHIVGRHSMRILGKHVYPHLIRDCVAFWILKQNPENYLMVSRLLGHRDIQTTINIYGHIDPEDAAEYFDQLRLKKSKGDDQDNG